MPLTSNVAYVGNSLGGLLTGQEGVRGQVVLQHSGITGIPIVNVENACASAMTALRGAWLEVASGAADVALAVGVEKMDVGDNARTIGALSGVSELDLSEMGMRSPPATRSIRKSTQSRVWRNMAGPRPISPSRR